MLEVNEFLVLDLVRERGETTRPEIAEALGLSASTVSRIVARLVLEGLILEVGVQAGAAGRPRSRIAFNPRAGGLLAVDLGGTRCHGALADLSGEILFEDERRTRDYGSAFDALLATISTIRRSAVARRLTLLGAVIGIPAILDPSSGRAIGGPRVDWDDFEIVSRLAGVLPIPFLVENDVNLAALAHAWRGEARGVSDFVVVSVGTGIGGAIVADGRLVKGHHNAGGEVGYIAVERGQLDLPVERGLGVLEVVASGPAIVRRAEERASDAGLRRRAHSTLPRTGEITAEAVFAAAAGGDPLATEVIDDAVDHLSLALTAIAATVDPELVILEGSIGRSLGPYVDVMRGRLQRRLPAPPELVVSSLDAATVVGGIAAALQVVREQRAPDALTGALGSMPWSARTIAGSASAPMAGAPAGPGSGPDNGGV
jgi:predicted NBD/HSP70 family sugar kinase